MSTVLLATDGSEIATSAMARGIEVLGRDHRFVMLAVVPHAFIPADGMGPLDVQPTIDDPALEVEVEAAQREAQAEGIDRLHAALGIEAEELVETGEAGPTICAVAQRIGADVIVVGSHGHGFFKRMLMGSVSTHVLHEAHCPVLVVRTDQDG